MKIDSHLNLFLNANATFNGEGILVSLNNISDEIVNAIDKEFIIPLHNELVDRRDIQNQQHPNEWFDKTITLQKKDWKDKYRSFEDFGNLNGIVYDATKYYNINISNDDELHLTEFERYIKENRNVYFETEDVYGYKVSREFYGRIISGEICLKVGDRNITCVAKRIKQELLFCRKETNKEVKFEVDTLSGKEIAWYENEIEIMRIEIDPIFKALYRDFVNNPTGLTTSQLINENKSYGSYKRKISDDENKAINLKNVTDYISRLNKELQNKGVPMEYRISRSDNLRFITYLRYKI